MSDKAASTLPATGARLGVERQGHVLVLTLDDAPTRNALHGESLFRAFEEVVAEANADLDVRALVFEGR